MKKYMIALLTVFLLVLSGCTLPWQDPEPEILASFPKDAAPVQVVKTPSYWVKLNGTYGGLDFSLSVSETPEPIDTVYSVSGVGIWYLDANDKAVVWCETTDTVCTYKAYRFQTQTTETIFQVTIENEAFQPQNIGIYNNFAYFCTIDYARQEVRVMAYDLDTKATKTIHTAPLQEENQPYAINLQNAWLSIFCSAQIKVINLDSNTTVFEAALPANVKHVFAASYDHINDTCALYYADEDSEDIGILKKGETQIASVFTFNDNHYAYHDTIRCYDGHIYWIGQSNVSGYVTDHYRLVDYNYLTHKPVETARTFSFYLDGNQLYSLRFNQRGDYTKIDLCQY